MIRSRLFLMLAPALLLSGCFEDAPPAGYEAVPAQDALQMSSQCPDLKGSFDLSTLPLGGAITDQTPPETKGLPVLMTFKQGVTNPEAWWVVPTEAVRRWADNERQRNRRNYSRWLTLVLQRPGRLARASDLQAFRDAVAKLGPPAGPVYAGTVGNLCIENWLRIRQQPNYRGSPGNPDGDGMGEKEIWLARDRSGALLVKTLHFPVKPFRVWGDAATTIRSSASATWSKVEVTDFADPVLLTESDLPAILPVADVATCDDMANRLADLSNRIIRNAPSGIMVVSATAQKNNSTVSVGECPGMILELHLSGKDPQQLALMDGQILRDPFVRSVSVLSSSNDKPPLRKLRIVLKEIKEENGG